MIYKNGYQIKTAVDCFSSCLFSYLTYAGIDISIEEAFLAGGGLRVSACKEKGEHIKLQRLVTEVYIDAMEQYGVPITYTNCIEQKQDPREFLMKSIQEEKKLMIRLSTKYLDYNNVFSQNAEMGHFVNVTGYEDGQVYFCDGYVPTRIISVYEGSMELEKILNIWATKDYSYAVLEVNDENLQEVKKHVMCADFKEKILQDLLWYCNGEQGDRRTGAGAVEAMAASLYDFIGKPADDIFKKTYGMVYDLKLLGFFIGKQCLLELIKQERYFSKEYQEAYESIHKEWNSIFLNLLKIKYFPNEQYISKLEGKILKLNKRECDFYREICSRSK